MKKTTILYLVIFLLSFNSYAQNTVSNDSLIVLPNDIYSNFKNDVYTPSKDFKVFMNKKGDSVKVLSDTYDNSVTQADKYFNKSDFINALVNYKKALRDNHDLGKVKDRYNTACCYSMLENFDSAFIELERIISIGKYYSTEEIESEILFTPLHKDIRWALIIKNLKRNRGALKQELDNSIHENQF